MEEEGHIGFRPSQGSFAPSDSVNKNNEVKVNVDVNLNSSNDLNVFSETIIQNVITSTLNHSSDKICDLGVSSHDSHLFISTLTHSSEQICDTNTLNHSSEEMCDLYVPSNVSQEFTSTLNHSSDKICDLGVSSHDTHVSISEGITPDRFFNICPSTTRGHDFKLAKPRCNTAFRLQQFSQRIINEWNSLPKYVVNSKDLNDFKSKLDQHWNHDIIYKF